MTRYIVVILYGSEGRKFDCVSGDKMFLTPEQAQAHIDKCVAEDKAREWAYRYEIVRVKE